MDGQASFIRCGFFNFLATSEARLSAHLCSRPSKHIRKLWRHKSLLSHQRGREFFLEFAAALCKSFLYSFCSLRMNVIIVAGRDTDGFEKRTFEGRLNHHSFLKALLQRACFKNNNSSSKETPTQGPIITLAIFFYSIFLSITLTTYLTTNQSFKQCIAMTLRGQILSCRLLFSPQNKKHDKKGSWQNILELHANLSGVETCKSVQWSFLMNEPLFPVINNLI